MLIGNVVAGWWVREGFEWGRGVAILAPRCGVIYGWHLCRDTVLHATPLFSFHFAFHFGQTELTVEFLRSVSVPPGSAMVVTFPPGTFLVGGVYWIFDSTIPGG